MSRAKLWDELWVAEKFQSSSAIAGSPRNSFRASLVNSPLEVEHWMGWGGFLPTQSNQTPNAKGCYNRSQTVRAKLHRSKGKQPRSPSKVPKLRLSGEGSAMAYTTRRLA